LARSIIISVKRRLPDLAHVLDDVRPMASVPVKAQETERPGFTPGRGIDKRIHTRFDKAFLVVIGSELYGDSFAIARNISAGGLLVEMSYAPPLGTVVTVHFQYMREGDVLDEIVARAEVKHHHYLNFTGGNDAASARAIGLRFIEFLDPGDRVEAERIH
jgi:PilZ domain-containing protein